MRASLKLKPPEKYSARKVAAALRKQLRYHFAELLAREQFAQALREAEIAHQQQNILAEDLQFVRDIVENSRGPKRSWSLSASEPSDFPHDFSLKFTQGDPSM